MSVCDIGYPHLKSSQSNPSREPTPTIIPPIYINGKIALHSYIYYLDDQDTQRDSLLYDDLIELLFSPLYRRFVFYHHEFL